MSTATPSVWRERLASPLTWHIVGAGVLLALAVVLGARFALDWAATSGRNSDALASKQTELKVLDMQTAPLRGMDKRIAATRDEIKDFYAKRIPANYSAIESRIDELQIKSGVRLSRLQYTPGKTSNDLTEIVLDAGISGDYPQVMRFINSLERDKNFFVLRAMQLTSQQGGQVALRLRVSTWLRPADAKELPGNEKLPAAPSSAPNTNGSFAPGAGGKEGQQP